MCHNFNQFLKGRLQGKKSEHYEIKVFNYKINLNYAEAHEMYKNKGLILATFNQYEEEKTQASTLETVLIKEHDLLRPILPKLAKYANLTPNIVKIKIFSSAFVLLF